MMPATRPRGLELAHFDASVVSQFVQAKLPRSQGCQPASAGAARVLFCGAAAGCRWRIAPWEEQKHVGFDTHCRHKAAGELIRR
jgi:transposase